MPAVPETELDSHKGLVKQSEWRARRQEERDLEHDTEHGFEDDQATEELEIARYCKAMMAVGIRARQPYEIFDRAWDYFTGKGFWPANMPPGKSKIMLNKIRAIIIFMLAVMTDQKPRLNVDPVIPGTEDIARLLGKILDREWDDTQAQDVITLACFYGLVWGTGFVKVVQLPPSNGRAGKRALYAIPPYRLFFNPGATCVEDAEWIIHVEKKPLGWACRTFKEKANAIRAWANGTLVPTEPGVSNDRDYVQEGDPGRASRVDSPALLDGQTVRAAADRNGKILPQFSDIFDNQLYDVYDIWFRDDANDDIERLKRENGMPVFEDVYEVDYPEIPVLEPDNTVREMISPIDGKPFLMPLYHVKQKPVYIDDTEPRFPNGRNVVMVGPVVCRDIPNWMQIDGFPFADWRSQDIGCIWGQGEVLGLKDANIGMVRSASTLYDNLNLAGNTSWLVKRDSGLNTDTLQNKVAQIIPVDNVDTDVKALEKSFDGGGFINFFNLLKGEMPGLAGLNDAMIGGEAPSNTAFATMDQLQENGAAPLRLKTRNFERMITRIGKLMVALIQQFDEGDRPIRSVEKPLSKYQTIYDSDGEPTVVPVVEPEDKVKVKWDVYSNAMLQGHCEVGIVPDSSLATSPTGLFNRLMTLKDKGIIDDVYVIDKLNLDDGKALIQRKAAAAAQAAAAKKKPGPKGGAGSSKSPRATQPSQGNHNPTPADMAAHR